MKPNRLANSQRASVMTGGGFFRSTKFRYSGRTEREILTESLNALRQQLNNTSPSKRKANSVPATPSSPQGELSELRMMNRKCSTHLGSHDPCTIRAKIVIVHRLGYSSIPRSTMSEPFNCADRYCSDNVVPCLETVSEEVRRHAGKCTRRDLFKLSPQAI